MYPASSDDRSEPVIPRGGPRAGQSPSLPSSPGPAPSHGPAASLLETRSESFRRYLDFNPHFDGLKSRIEELSALPQATLGDVRVASRDRIEILCAGQWVEIPLANPGEIAGFARSPDGRYIAIGTTRDGADWETWEIRDVSDLARPPELISSIRYSTPAWSASGDALYYARYPDPDPSVPSAPLGAQTLYKHVVGQAQALDSPVFAGGAPASRIEPYPVGDSLVILDRDGCSVRSDVWICRSDGTSSKVDTSGLLNLRYSGADAGALYFTADDPSLSRKIYSLDPTSAAIQPCSVDTPLDNLPIHYALRASSGFLVVKLEDMAHRVFFSTPAGSAEMAISPAGTVHSAWEGKDGEIVLLVSSFTRPATLIGFDPGTWTMREIETPEVTIDPTQYVTRHLHCKSADGADIPVSLFYRAGSPPAPDRPALLSAYGGFGEPLTRSFSASRIAWVEAGGVWADVAVRGGGELGASWHLPWIGDGKAQASADLVDAAESLVTNGMASSHLLALRGYSTGGLVAAKSMLSRPDLFRAGVIDSGLLDLEHYLEYSAGAAWLDEFGDPKANADESPVTLARRGDPVPALLITVCSNDEKVPPVHSESFVKALEARGNQPFVLMQDGAGHRTESSPLPPTGPAASTAAERRAAELAFVMDTLGMV